MGVVVAVVAIRDVWKVCKGGYLWQLYGNE